MKISAYSKTLRDFPNRNILNPNNSDVRALMMANGIYDKRENDRMYNYFLRIPAMDPYNAVTVTHEYLFFTKPDLHLMNSNGKVATSLAKYPFFIDAVDRYKPVCEQLQLSCKRNTSSRGSNLDLSASKNPFATLLSNTVKSELELPGIESENDQETGANVYGTKITYRGNSYTSDQDCSFSLEFEDTKYLEVYMFFKIYDEYCRYKNMGLIEFTDPEGEDLIWVNYTLNKVLHDQFSVYKFVVGEDGMTLLYWAKYTGVYPTGVPRDAFSNMNNEEGQRLTVNFKAQFVRDMDPIILSEFNNVALNDTNNYSHRGNLPLFDQNRHHIDGTWSIMPYIARVDYRDETTADKMTRYRLLWKR